MEKLKLLFLVAIWLETCLGFMLGGPYGGMDPMRSYMGVPGGYGGHQPSCGMGRALDEIDYQMRMFRLLKTIENGPSAMVSPMTSFPAPVLALSPQQMPIQYQPAQIGYTSFAASPSESLEAPQHQPQNSHDHVAHDRSSFGAQPHRIPIRQVGTVGTVPNQQPFTRYGRTTPPTSTPSRHLQSTKPRAIHPPLLHSEVHDDFDRKQDELKRLKESAKEVQDSAVNMKESLHRDEHQNLTYGRPAPVQYPEGQPLPQQQFYPQPSMPQAYEQADQASAAMEEPVQPWSSYQQSPNTQKQQQFAYNPPEDHELALKRAELERMKATVRELQETARKMKESIQNGPQPVQPHVVPPPQAPQPPPPQQSAYSQPQYSWPHSYPASVQPQQFRSNVASRSPPQQPQSSYQQQQYSWPQNYQPRSQPAPSAFNPAYVNPSKPPNYQQTSYPGRRPWYSRLPNMLLPRQYQQPRSYP